MQSCNKQLCIIKTAVLLVLLFEIIWHLLRSSVVRVCIRMCKMASKEMHASELSALIIRVSVRIVNYYGNELYVPLTLRATKRYPLYYPV